MSGKRPRVLSDRLGDAHAARLSSIIGGTRLRIPMGTRRPEGGGRDGFKRLVGLVGEELAILLVFHFGDSVIYVPVAVRSLKVDLGAVAALSHLSAAKAARRLGCSERTVDAKRAVLKSRKPKRERKSA